MMRIIILFLTYTLLSTSAFGVQEERPRKIATASYFVNALLTLDKNADVKVTPLRFGLFVNEYDMLGVEYGNGKFTSKNGQRGLYATKGLYYRFFLGDSFNVLGGVFNRQLSGTFTYQTSGEYIKSRMIVDTYVGTLSVGNQWLFGGGAVVGIDWIYNSSLIYRDKHLTLVNSDLETSTRNAARAKLDRIAEDAVELSASSGLLLGTFGISF